MQDVQDHVARLLRKALGQGVRVAVTAEADTLKALDAALWTRQAADFLPHLLVLGDRPPDSTLAITPAWLVSHPALAVNCSVLVNVGDEVPPDWARFDRLIEVVAADGVSRQAGRRRWRAYEAQRVPIDHVRMDLPPAERRAQATSTATSVAGAGH